MLLQKLRQYQQAVFEQIIRHGKSARLIRTDKRLILAAFGLINPVTFQQKPEPHRLFPYNSAQHYFCLFKVFARCAL